MLIIIDVIFTLPPADPTIKDKAPVLSSLHRDQLWLT